MRFPIDTAYIVLKWSGRGMFAHSIRAEGGADMYMFPPQTRRTSAAAIIVWRDGTRENILLREYGPSAWASQEFALDLHLTKQNHIFISFPVPRWQVHLKGKVKYLRGAFRQSRSLKWPDFPCPSEPGFGIMPLSSALSLLHILCEARLLPIPRIINLKCAH